MDYLLEKLKDYKILYCEDDEEVSNLFLSLIEKISKNIIYAKDGEEGLKLFYKEKPDIIITDIEMPRKDGIEIIEEIRKKDEEIPIIIITAFENKDFLLKSIDLNVTNFLIKPINEEKLLKTLKDIIAFLEDKKIAEKFRIIKEKINLKQNTRNIINQFLDISVEPIIIVKNGKVVNFNKEFEKLFFAFSFTEEQMKLLLNDAYYLNNLIEKREGFKSSLSDFNEENYYKNKISVKNQSGKRMIFQVIIKKVHFKEDKDESIIYTFQNITYLEYQKLKVENYSKRLEDFIIGSKYKKGSKLENKEIQNKLERNLDDEEEKLLRKNHSDKISAQEFLSTLDDYIIADIQELEECEEEVDFELNKFIENHTKEQLNDIILNMEKYARAIKNLQEFDELYEAINSTINLLRDIEILNDENIPKIQNFIKNIFLDLKSWRKTIFEEYITKDIHYLDSSLFSSCLQFELDLKNEKPEEDEGDFEFF